MRHMTEDALQSLIKAFEGYKSTAYKCPAGVWTLGFGSTIWLNGEPVTAAMTCNRQTAEQVLRRDLRSFEQWVDSKLKHSIIAANPDGQSVTVPVPQWVFDGQVSLCYNIGAGAWANSTLLKKLNKGSFVKWERQS